jgi:hypothetical protein
MVQSTALLCACCWCCCCYCCRFNTVYVDGKIRIAQDIRGDTLIVENDGPPRIFT